MPAQVHLYETEGCIMLPEGQRPYGTRHSWGQHIFQVPSGSHGMFCHYFTLLSDF